MAGNEGKWVWFELIAPDAGKGAQFAQDALGWNKQVAPMGDFDYTMLGPGEAMQCGVTAPQKDMGDVPAHWAGYLQVDDVDARAQAVTAHGGRILAPAFDIPTVGRMCPVMDPQGAFFYLFHGEGDGSGNQSRFHWMELWTSDREAAVAFYTQALGLSASEMDMPDGSKYSILALGEAQMGGVMTSPHAGVPPMWLPYAQVDDPDAVLDRATAQGGAVHMPAMDMPGIGRFGIYADDQGAALGVIKPA